MKKKINLRGINYSFWDNNRNVKWLMESISPPLTKVHVYYKYVAKHSLGLNSLHIANFCK